MSTKTMREIGEFLRDKMHEAGYETVSSCAEDIIRRSEEASGFKNSKSLATTLGYVMRGQRPLPKSLRQIFCDVIDVDRAEVSKMYRQVDEPCDSGPLNGLIHKLNDILMDQVDDADVLHLREINRNQLELLLDAHCALQKIQPGLDLSYEQICFILKQEPDH